MSANYNEETAFPYMNIHIRKDYPITTDAIEDWIKRCMDDWEEPKTVWDFYVEYQRLLKWRKKWFTQFRNEKE